MAFDPLNRLEQGDTDFLFDFTMSDINITVDRIRKSPNKLSIINGCAPKLKNTYSRFLLRLIYDIEEYSELTKELLNNNVSFFDSYEKIANIINNTSWGKEYFITNINRLYLYNKSSIPNLINLLLNDFDNNIKYIKELSIHHNLKIRYLFMKQLISYKKERLLDIYDDITKYLTSSTYEEYEQLTFLPTLMNIEDISDLAITIYKSNDINLWLKFKEYIFKTYSRNDLAELLISLGEYKEVNSDIDHLFETSRTYRLNMMQNKKLHISKNLTEPFKNTYNMFRRDDGKIDDNLYSIFTAGLDTKLKEFVEKYLDLSKYSKEISFVSNGSTSSCYRIGDYVIKLVSKKWSYEDIICPDLFLIIKDIEEVYIRDSLGIVNGGLEVQKFLHKSAKNIPQEIFELYHNALKNLGYFLNDSLLNGTCGDNCFLLDSYKDADHNRPDLLPDWFKQYPLVLIDRDRVYKTDNTHIKQLRSGY